MDNIICMYQCAGDDVEAKVMAQLDGHDGYISSIKYISETEMLSAGESKEDLSNWRHLKRLRPAP